MIFHAFLLFMNACVRFSALLNYAGARKQTV